MTNHNIQSLGRQVPSDWKIQRLGDLGEVRGRVGWKGYTKKDLVQSGALAIGGRQMGSNCRLDLSEPVHLSQAKFVESPEIAIKRDDILIAQRGTLGKIALVDQEIGDATINPSLVIFRPRLICSVYATYFLASTAGQLQIEEATSKTGVPMISQKQIENMLIARPSCEREEALIAEVLNDIEHQLSALELELDKKSQVKQAAMQELLNGKRRLPGFEGEWAQVSLGSVAAMNSGGTPPTGRDDFYGGVIPWVSISDMTSSGQFISETERTLSDLGLANCAAKRFPAGTILYAMYASLGECSIAAREVTTSQAILGIRPESSLLGEYLYYWLESIRGAVKLMGQQGTQSHLNKKIVQGFSLRLPSKPEQAAIAKVLCEIDQDIDALTAKSEKARAIKAGMMQQLLTGKIRLR